MNFQVLSKPKPIKVRPRSENAADWVVMGGRSHQSDEFKAFMEDYADAEIISIGSFLKLCLVAEGKADLYPRLELTSAWDTAASRPWLRPPEVEYWFFLK